MEEGHVNNTEHSEHNVHHEIHEVHHKKKMNWKNIGIFGGLLILVIIAVILLFVAFKPSQSIEKYNVTYVVSLANGTNVLTGNSVLTADSLSSILGFTSDKIDTELKTLNVGEEKTFTLSAEDAFGTYDPEKNMSLNRTERIERNQIIQRQIVVGLTDFTDAFDEQPIVGKTYSLASVPWEYKVITSDRTDVQLSIETNIGKIIPGSLFSSEVVAINETAITLKIQGTNTVVPGSQGDTEYTFDNNYIYSKFTPTTKDLDFGNGVIARVLGFTEDKIFVDTNTLYAGQEITVKLKLEDKFTEKIASSNQGNIAGAPTMQVFIMSHCPFGTQMVKGVLPVMEKFKNKANIEIRFVSYTMHGAQEELDNNRIICVREEQNSKLIPYLECFVSNTGSEADSQKCITQIGLDKSKLESCMSSRVDAYMKADSELNTKYGVQGSPTVVINGEEASIYPRDPQSVANALCNAFGSNKPSECSLTFSTTNPSAGFGTGSSTSSGGSCG